MLAARDQTFSKSVADQAVRAAAASYRERMSEYAEMTVLDAWYATRQCRTGNRVFPEG